MKLLKEATVTPWGRADQVSKLATGIMWVSTPSHGGLMISKGVAEKLLSDAALEEGLVYGGYYGYEEDVAWCIPCYENEKIAKLVFGSSDRDSEGKSYNTFMDELKKTVERYFTKYLDRKAGGAAFSIPVGTIIHAYANDPSNNAYYKILQLNYPKKNEVRVSLVRVNGNGQVKHYRQKLSTIEDELERGYGVIVSPSDPMYSRLDRMLV